MGVFIPTIRQAGIIQFKNCTAENRERFDLLWLDDPIFLSDENETSFKDWVMFDGVVPVDPDHKGKFVVLLEPLKPNAIGMACIDGVCPAWVTLPATGGSTSPTYADIADGDASALHASNTGAAQILWLDPTIAAGDSGWAVVRIGAPPALPFWAKITGNAAISGNANRWQYAWTEQRETPTGWEDLPSGRSGTTTSKFALNSIEANNPAAPTTGQFMGNGVDTVTSGTTLAPVRGDPVVLMHPGRDTAGNDTYRFAYENTVEC